jgi:hypothetical protein
LVTHFSLLALIWRECALRNTQTPYHHAKQYKSKYFQEMTVDLNQNNSLIS